MSVTPSEPPPPSERPPGSRADWSASSATSPAAALATEREDVGHRHLRRRRPRCAAGDVLAGGEQDQCNRAVRQHRHRRARGGRHQRLHVLRQQGRRGRRGVRCVGDAHVAIEVQRVRKPEGAQLVDQAAVGLVVRVRRRAGQRMRRETRRTGIARHHECVAVDELHERRRLHPDDRATTTSPSSARRRRRPASRRWSCSASPSAGTGRTPRRGRPGESGPHVRRRARRLPVSHSTHSCSGGPRTLGGHGATR